MFYKLMYKRSFRKYFKSYINILIVFIVSLSMLSFTNIYCDSYYNYDEAVLVPYLTKDHTCDIRVRNITEEQAKMYSDIPNVSMEYIDGNLDFFLLDITEFETVLAEIQEIFNDYHYLDRDHIPGSSSEDPTINIYYGKEVKVKKDIGTRIGIIIFQLVLSGIGIAAMIMIYGDYIGQRADDIRNLSALGITERQLHKLFFRECNVLYLSSVLVGIPLGGVIAYLFFKMSEGIDFSESNAIYPVFDLNIASIMITALAGYLVVYITFRIVLRKILQIDASYTCQEVVLEFNPDKSRELYYKAERNFDSFFALILNKRGSSKSRGLTVLTAFVIAISVFMINAVNYSVSISNSYGERDLAAISTVISNSSIFIMTIAYAFVYSLMIIIIFNKRQLESMATTAQILYTLGADEYAVYSAFRIYTIRKILWSVIPGFVIGYVATFLIFAEFSHRVYLNIWLIMGNVALIAAYYFVNMISMRRYFIDNCRCTVLDGEEDVYGAC